MIATNKITKEEALVLLGISNKSKDFYKLLSVANQLTRTQFNNKGYIFSQINIKVEPYLTSRKSCSERKSHYAMDSIWIKDLANIRSEMNLVVDQNISDLFLWTNENFPFPGFIEIGKEIKNRLSERKGLVANIGDFDVEKALILKKAGFTGAYYMKSLRGYVDTDINPEARTKTLDAIIKSGLDLYYCLELRGSEYGYDKLVDEMLKAREYNVNVMGVTRRSPISGNAQYDKGHITDLELAKIAAVTRIVTRPTKAMNLHEVTSISLIGGVNQLYAKMGTNPKGTSTNIENTGNSVSRIKNLLLEAEYDL